MGYIDKMLASDITGRKVHEATKHRVFFTKFLGPIGEIGQVSGISIFIVCKDGGGGWCARCIDRNIFVEARTISKLKKKIRDAVDCHYAPKRKEEPKVKNKCNRWCEFNSEFGCTKDREGEELCLKEVK